MRDQIVAALRDYDRDAAIGVEREGRGGGQGGICLDYDVARSGCVGGPAQIGVGTHL